MQDVDLKQVKRKIEFLGKYYAFEFEPFTVAGLYSFKG
jgi:hypothetical protein